MKFNDAVWGVGMVAFAAALFWHVQGFPTIPGQKIGPAVLPELLSFGIGVCGAILVVRGLRRHAAGSAPWIERPAWWRAPRQVRAFALLVAVNVLYLVAVDRLGFVIVGTVYLATMMWALRVRLSRALPLALVLTLLVHFAFYKLLKVPLPWGVLQPVAW